MVYGSNRELIHTLCHFCPCPLSKSLQNSPWGYGEGCGSSELKTGELLLL